MLLYGCASPQDAGGSAQANPTANQALETPGIAAREPSSAGVRRAQRPTNPASAPPPAAGAPANKPIIITPIDGNGQKNSGAGGEPVATFVDARPAAMIDGKSVTWGDLRPILGDLAGAEALREYILDRKLARALDEAKITISDDDVAAERKTLLESLNDDPNTAIRLLDELRSKQNLGKKRFDGLLRRNAGLRALVRKDGAVNITDDALRSMHDMLHGPKRQARIMLLSDLSRAQAAINLVNTGVSFADAAVEMSTDSSAARGGLLEPISQSDPNYPEALRQTLFTLNTGEMSGPVLLGDKYAVVFMVKRTAADGVTLQDARPALERIVRINQERVLMDQLARRLTLDTAVTVFDEELNDSWQRAKRGK